MKILKSAVYLMFSLVPSLMLMDYLLDFNWSSNSGPLVLGVICVATTAGLVLYIMHLWKNPDVQRGNRELWLLTMLLLFTPVSILYWFFYLLPNKV